MKIYPQDVPALCEMYHSGMSYEAIALAVGVDHRTVEKKIKAAGVISRPAGGYRGHNVAGKTVDGVKGAKPGVRQVRSKYGRARQRKGRYA